MSLTWPLLTNLIFLNYKYKRKFKTKNISFSTLEIPILVSNICCLQFGFIQHHHLVPCLLGGQFLLCALLIIPYTIFNVPLPPLEKCPSVIIKGAMWIEYISFGSFSVSAQIFPIFYVLSNMIKKFPGTHLRFSGSFLTFFLPPFQRAADVWNLFL